jgi:hypothetical protein
MLKVDLIIRRLHLVQGDREATRPEALEYGGAFAHCHFIHPSHSDESILKNDPIPSLSGIAILDTGSDHSAIRRDAVDWLGLTPNTEKRESKGAHGDASVELCEWKIVLTGLSSLIVTVNGFISEGLAGNGEKVDTLSYYGKDCIGLIGRDVLRHCILVYDGPSGACTVEYPEPT